jgi:hypothetical protein
MFRSILALSSLLSFSSAHTLAARGVEDFSNSLFPRTQTDGASEWPYGPFKTQGRDIVNSRGDVVTFAGINWPGSGETMIPEGLEFASLDDIMSGIKDVGFNFIRL